MLRFLPQIYDWIIQLKIRRLYDEMRLIESEMEAAGHGFDANIINANLDQLEQRANRLRLPTAYASMLYTLRMHIGLIRDHISTKPNQKPR